MENEETTQVKEETKSTPKAKKEETAKTKTPKKNATKNQTAQGGTTVLVDVGQAAIARHGFSVVYVTSDGLAFAQEGDAKNHALDLKNNEIIKVTKQ